VAWVIKPNKWIDACGVEADNAPIWQRCHG